MLTRRGTGALATGKQSPITQGLCVQEDHKQGLKACSSGPHTSLHYSLPGTLTRCPCGVSVASFELKLCPSFRGSLLSGQEEGESGPQVVILDAVIHRDRNQEVQDQEGTRHP